MHGQQAGRGEGIVERTEVLLDVIDDWSLGQLTAVAQVAVSMIGSRLAKQDHAAANDWSLAEAVVLRLGPVIAPPGERA